LEGRRRLAGRRDGRWRGSAPRQADGPGATTVPAVPGSTGRC